MELGIIIVGGLFVALIGVLTWLYCNHKKLKTSYADSQKKQTELTKNFLEFTKNSIEVGRNSIEVSKVCTDLTAKINRTIATQFDITQAPKALGILREFQETVTIFLKKITNIFDKHNIPYWLDGGTLLGCIRHKGFIPWDDDLDIGMLRGDYQKLPSIFEQEFKNDPNFVLKSLESNFSKVLYNGTTLSVDVFPLDVYTKYLPDADSRSELKKTIEAYYGTIEHSNEDISSLLCDINKTILEQKGTKNPEKELQDIAELKGACTKFLDPEKAKESLILFGIDTEWHRIFNCDWIFPLKKAIFEGITFNVPNKSEIYLFEEYGDWMQMPDELHYHNSIIAMTSLQYANMLEFKKKYN